ncbi:MAG: holo-ACP synthase [Pirellulaceae bacterium]|nr:holo-ACP synthase [Planctomycetales bacterium]
MTTHIIGIGTEIVECVRVARMIERHDERFLRRVFTTREIEYCSSRRFATQAYACCWAAKEAVLRAMATRWQKEIDYRDIEIRFDPQGGRTGVAFAGGVREVCERYSIGDILVTTAHCRTHATAYAIAMARDPDESEIQDDDF